MAVIGQKCLECDEFFEMNEDEQKWYKDRGYVFPKRCKSCRDLRRRKIIGKEDVNYGKTKK